MGTDIYSASGVICEVDQAVKFINGKNKAAVIKICAEFYDDLVVNAKKYPKEQCYQNTVKFFEPLKKFVDGNHQGRIGDIRDIVSSVVKVSGKPGKYDLDTHVLESAAVELLFCKIIDSYGETMGVDIPHLAEISAWGSANLNGWDIPKGVACFVFDKHACYTEQVSDGGKALKKVIGHCEVTEWTEYSC